MRLFKQYYLAYSKKDTIHSLVQRVKHWLDESGINRHEILFCFTDHESGFSSAIEKAVKKVPYLCEFEFQLRGNSENALKNYSVLSNLPSFWKEANPNNKCINVDFSVIEEIAKGIPKPYSFNHATIIFDKIDWFGNRNMNCEYIPYKSMSEIRSGSTELVSALKPFAHPDGFNKIYPSSSIIIQSNWWTPTRHTFMGALVEIPVPEASCNRIPELDDKVIRLMSTLGKPAGELLVAVPSPDELASIELSYPKAQKLIDEIQANFTETLEKISLPYDLKDIDMGNPREESVSVKQSILKILKPLGYKYLSGYSGQGGYYVTKKTHAYNQIKLFIDTGEFLKDLSCRFIFEGPFYSHWLELRDFFVASKNMFYPTNTQKSVDEVISNIGAIVSYLEVTLVKKLDALYPGTPEWYEYQK